MASKILVRRVTVSAAARRCGKELFFRSLIAVRRASPPLSGAARSKVLSVVGDVAGVVPPHDGVGSPAIGVSS